MRLVHAFCLACLNLRNDMRKGSVADHHRHTQREHHRAFLHRHEM
jgi:hypothetical protein